MEYLVYDEFGEVAEEIKKITLVAKERIHEVQVRVIPTDFNYHVVFTQLGATEQVQWVDLPSDDKNYIDMITRMITDEDRNDLAWEFLEPCLRAGHTIMIATERVSHAKYWNDRIRDAGYASGLMLGGAAYAEQFEVTSNALRAGKILAGVGTIQKISTGHDIPRWNRGFVMTPLVKNRQKLEQLFGRLRRTHESKTDVVVYYMWDRKIYPSHKSRLVNLYKGHVQTFTEGDFL